MIRYIGTRLSMFLSGALRWLTGGDMYESFSGHLGRSQRGDFGPVWRVILWPVALANDCVWWLLGDGWGHNRRSIGRSTRERPW